MNEFKHRDCERIEAMMASWFDRDGLPAGERAELTAHVAACASCRESFALARQMEDALVSRRAEVPPMDSLLPKLQPANVRATHPKLMAAFRTMMSPAGIAIILVMWSTMLAHHFRESIARVLELSSAERFSVFYTNLSNLLMTVARGDAYTLIGIYVVLTLVVLGSTGAITLRYIRHS